MEFLIPCTVHGIFAEGMGYTITARGKVNPFTLYSLWVRFFLTIGHINQRMTHLRRLCVTVGAASQISYMRTEDICFYNTKYHLDLCRIITSKDII